MINKLNKIASGNQKEHHFAKECLKATFMLVIVASLLIGSLPPVYASSQNDVGVLLDEAWIIDTNSNEIRNNEYTIYKSYRFQIHNRIDNSDEQIEEIRLTFTPSEEGIIEDKSNWERRCSFSQVDPYTAVGRDVLEDGGFGMNFRTGDTKRMFPPFSIERAVDNIYFESTGTQMLTVKLNPQSSFDSIGVSINAISTPEADVRVLSCSMDYAVSVTDDRVGFEIPNPRRGDVYVLKTTLQITPKKGKGISYIPGVWAEFREINDEKGSTIGKTATITTDFGTGGAVSSEELNLHPLKRQYFAASLHHQYLYPPSS
ncbi:MAG: hypothetical protein IBX41_04535 [Methanophagales archaeon]|nr:hypothetical protein [Methanophagales archaeon]